MPDECPWCEADGRQNCPDHADGSLLAGLASAVTIEAILLALILLVLLVR